jgi:hypothetical protein
MIGHLQEGWLTWHFASPSEGRHRLRVYFEYRVLRKIFGPKKEGVTKMVNKFT